MALKDKWVDKIDGVDVNSANDINQVAHAVIELENKESGIAEETDPTVPSWAKEKQKPTYTASEVGALPANTKIPSNTSDLNNDSGFITRLVSDLANYYTKSQTYTQEEIRALISAIPKFSISVVSSLPTANISTTTIYLVGGGTGSDLYTEYIYANGKWEILGAQRVDLTGYATQTWVSTQLSSYLKSSELDSAINDALTKAKESGEFDGADGKTPVKGTDYWTPTERQAIKDELISSIVTQEAGQSEGLVMSQKAVTDLVAEAIGSGGGGGGTSTEYETVDSVDEMTDTSKQYVLKETGTIWAYGEVTVEKEAENKLVPSTATLNQRLSGSSASVSGSSPGSFVTDFIAVSDMANISPYNVRLNWEIAFSGDNKIVYFSSSKTRLGNTVFSTSSAPDKNTTISSGETIIDIKTMGSTSTSAPSNWSDVAYVRLQLFVKPAGTSLTSDDVANLTITFDHEGGTTTINEWYDTGLTPSSGGGGNYVELLSKINKNASDISEVSNRVTSLETGSETLTIPTFWQSAVDACIAKIKALQVGRDCVTFPFFSDNHQRNGYAGMLIANIMKECHIPYCFFGGDSISSGTIADEATMIAQDKAFDTMMSYVPNGRMCRAVGNHDGYWYDGTNKFYYNRDQVYDLFLREESIAQNKHFGGEGTYYYIDDVASKVRWIVMDTNNAPVDDTQIAWVQNTALSFAESGWAVVFISHQPISNHYHAGITNAAAVVSAVTSTATSKNVPIIGWFSGHVHRDIITTKRLTGGNGSNAGTEAGDLGFTQVIITSDHTGIAYDDDTKHTVANDDQSHAIDFVTINKATRAVNITRLGIGSDRSYTY